MRKNIASAVFLLGRGLQALELCIQSSRQIETTKIEASGRFSSFASQNGVFVTSNFKIIGKDLDADNIAIADYNGSFRASRQLKQNSTLIVMKRFDNRTWFPYGYSDYSIDGVAGDFMDFDEAGTQLGLTVNGTSVRVLANMDGDWVDVSNGLQQFTFEGIADLKLSKNLLVINTIALGVSIFRFDGMIWTKAYPTDTHTPIVAKSIALDENRLAVAHLDGSVQVFGVFQSFGSSMLTEIGSINSTGVGVDIARSRLIATQIDSVVLYEYNEAAKGKYEEIARLTGVYDSVALNEVGDRVTAASERSLDTFSVSATCIDPSLTQSPTQAPKLYTDKDTVRAEAELEMVFTNVDSLDSTTDDISRFEFSTATFFEVFYNFEQTGQIFEVSSTVEVIGQSTKGSSNTITFLQQIDYKDPERERTFESFLREAYNETNRQEYRNLLSQNIRVFKDVMDSSEPKILSVEQVTGPRGSGPSSDAKQPASGSDDSKSKGGLYGGLAAAFAAIVAVIIGGTAVAQRKRGPSNTTKRTGRETGEDYEDFAPSSMTPSSLTQSYLRSQDQRQPEDAPAMVQAKSGAVLPNFKDQAMEGEIQVVEAVAVAIDD